MSTDEQNDPGSGPGFAGQVPDQAGAPARESLAGRVPGQAAAGQGGVTPEAFVAPVAPGRPVVPAPADPVDGERPPSDAELTARVRAGDDLAYEEIYRRHAASVRRYARTCCRDSFTAEDLAGEVFARTLQALRAGKGPEFAVRAYLLTAVRNVAAAWARSERREQLVDDFGDFALTSAAAVEFDLADPGADAWAMALADQRMVMQAFVELPEDDRVVLWHTEVERESPKTVAVLLGKTANATAVQAHRARDRLAAAFLQAHVSGSQESGCTVYANRLGAYARGSLRKRASGEVGRHVQGCDRCTAAYLELTDINTSLRAALPGGALLWIGAGSFGVAAAAAGAGAALGGAAIGGAAAASVSGSAAASGAAGAGAAGASSAAGAAGAGAAGSSGSAAGAVVGEGLGVAAKAGIAAGVAVAAVAVAAYALAGGPAPKPPVTAAAASSPAQPPPVAPVTPAPSAPAVPEPEPAPELPATPSRSPVPSPSPTPKAAPVLVPSPSAPPASPAPPSPTVPAPPVVEPPPPLPSPTVPTPPVPSPTPPPVPTRFWLDQLPIGGGHRDQPAGPVIRPGGAVVQRPSVWMRGSAYPHALSVPVPAQVTVDLNRSCSAFEAVAGLDDLGAGGGPVVFSVEGGDGRTLWRSGQIGPWDRPVRVRAALDGQRSVRLLVAPSGGRWSLINVADWAEARFTCT
ncbi:sigma-70 family RNA polymerase sigma factor [Kitasatospora sp. NPDC094015]|uniref:sigma-70 family RNA polymerase sigma factor n=1 Tax=Kitasatospora sp. NPDC094015 TaxID=3155205 RepID=UPI00332F8F63